LTLVVATLKSRSFLHDQVLFYQPLPMVDWVHHILMLGLVGVSFDGD